MSVSISTVIRSMFAVATVAFGVLGFASGDPRLFAASGAFGVCWWAWDLVLEYVFSPIEDFARRLLMEGAVGEPPPQTRPTMDDTIRLLESHVRRGASRQVDINSALRLAEIYETVKKDPERARQIIAVVKERYPDAEELRDRE